jgi:magnesium-transporting ATPase (P-type)
LGILIKNVADIEAAAKINAFVFDKTGTLTTGELAVSRLAPLEGVTPAELLRVAHDHPELRDCDVYVAGAPALLDAAREFLLAKGLPAEQLVLGYSL